MSPWTHRQLVSVEVMWPAQTLPLPLQQVVEALNQGETPDQIIIRMNQQGCWRGVKTHPYRIHTISFRYGWTTRMRRAFSATTLRCRCTDAPIPVTRN